MIKKSKKSSKIKLKKVEWYGLNHDQAKLKFEGNPKFINYMTLKWDTVAAVYHVKKPNKKKGHKNFLLLWRQGDNWMVGGATSEQIKEVCKVKGVLCTSCNTALFSLHRHHHHYCGCKNETFVDGGTDYLRVGSLDLSKTHPISIDLLTDKITLDKE